MGHRISRICGWWRAPSGNAHESSEEAAPFLGSEALPPDSEEEEEQPDEAQLEYQGRGPPGSMIGVVCEFRAGGWYRRYGSSEWIRWRTDEDDAQHPPNPQEPESHD
eukprot:TRINITY_DN28122_c0_g1_i1.p2 TRINITY_DN28122_c0_g1~~TRINITY_DN28122_c0_g1_i1.p2  ORF type:complete len:107 (+),score=22.57 TRINITY_DN28122_c0_g1_i1:83-403(+)